MSKVQIIDAIKFTIVLEFVIGLYPFSLPIELVLIPINVFFLGMVTVADMKQEHLPVKKLFEWILAFIGLIILWHSVRSLLADSGSFFTVKQLVELMLPSLLTFLFLPFLYFLALAVTYETVFMCLKLRNHNSTLIGFAKRQFFLYFGLKLGKLTRWLKQNPNLKVNSKAEVLELLGKKN